MSNLWDRLTRDLWTRRRAAGFGLAAAIAVPDAVAKRGKRRPKPAARCAAPRSSTAAAGQARVAATFVAARGGRLKRIDVEVVRRAGTFGDWAIQLVPVQGTRPMHAVQDILAAATASDDFPPDEPTMVRAAFAGPVLEQGQEYAVVVARRAGADVQLSVSDQCPDNRIYFAFSCNDPFQPDAPLVPRFVVFVD